MTKTARKLAAGAIAGGLASFALTVPTPAADAKDVRPCVSKNEFFGNVAMRNRHRDDLEAAWEVKPIDPRLMTHVFVADVPKGQYAVNYKWCAFGLDEAYVEVHYRKRSNRSALFFGFIAPDATAHGHDEFGFVRSRVLIDRRA